MQKIRSDSFKRKQLSDLTGKNERELWKSEDAVGQEEAF